MRNTHLTQLYVPGFWIKLSTTVHQQTAQKSAFLPVQEFLCIFSAFDNSLPVCLSSNQTSHYSRCALWLPPRPYAIFPSKHQCSWVSKLSASFLASLQWLYSKSSPWSPKPSLPAAPKLNPSSHSIIHEPQAAQSTLATQFPSPAPPYISDASLHYHPYPSHHPVQGIQPCTSFPTSCCCLWWGSQKLSQKHIETCQKSIQTRCWGQENKTYPGKSGLMVALHWINNFILHLHAQLLTQLME